MKQHKKYHGQPDPNAFFGGGGEPERIQNKVLTMKSKVKETASSVMVYESSITCMKQSKGTKLETELTSQDPTRWPDGPGRDKSRGR